jgi:hypothetical protein
MIQLISSVRQRYVLPCLVALSLCLGSCKKSADPEANPNPGGALNKKNVGASARDLLSADPYRTLVVEIQYAQGFAPTPAALENMRAFLDRHLHKSGDIVIRQNAIPAPGKSSYSVNDLVALEDRYRKEYTRKDTIAAYFFFADSPYAEDTDNSKVLGVAYRNTSMTIFERTVQSYSGGIGQPERSKLESAVINHEFGHILGLVNAGTPMQEQHQDTPHGRHCTSSSCLMNYVVETGNVVKNLLGNPVPGLDQQCINDLRANGGK